jgi:hypothetical protein
MRRTVPERRKAFTDTTVRVMTSDTITSSVDLEAGVLGTQ